MSIAFISLISLVLSIIIVCFKPKMNAGVIAIAMAFVIGIFGAKLPMKSIISGFPTDLFLMLISICLLFNMAGQNGTLEKLSKFFIKSVKGNPKLFPLLFFFMTFLLSAIGPGNIAATALMAPIGMAVASRASISSLLMAIMICTGANAGAFSPVSPTGIIGIGLMNKIGVNGPDMAMTVFMASAAIQSLSAISAYFIFKGYTATKTKSLEDFLLKQSVDKFDKKQILTLMAIIILVISVIFFKIQISLVAFSLVVFLSFMGTADEEKSIKNIPWGIILLVTGITILIGVMEKTGGLNMATVMIAKISSGKTINSVLAFITGVVSAYSSSSGVVMPAFIPLIPGIIFKLGTGNILEMIIAVAVGSHMVDVSPLSTLGALTIASADEKVDKTKLFRNLLIWGLSMAVIGAFLAFVFLDLLHIVKL